jgi:hypothetical protein
VVIAHQAHITAEGAATACETRHAHAARRSADAIAGALAELERLILADRAAGLAEQSRGNPLLVPGTAAPTERVGPRLAPARGRGASSRKRFRRWAPEFRRAGDGRRRCPCPPSAMRAAAAAGVGQLRASLTKSAVSLDAQLRLFAPSLDNR